MTGDVDIGPLVAQGRQAYAERRYDVAYRTLLAASSEAILPGEDVKRLADAAWWLGRISEVLSLTESLHRRYLDDGYVDRAALQAIDLAGMLFMRGEHAVALGWLSRGRRLLDGQPPTEGHAMLTYIEASEALETQDLDSASAHAVTLQQFARQFGDETFAALGLLVAGLVEIRRGRLREGCALLDEAMLPVLANQVRPEFAGNIYCTIVRTFIDLADLPRAREWARATERWVESFSDAVMFLGVCRAHRAEIYAAEGSISEAEREAVMVTRDLAELNVGAVAEAEYQHAETFRLRGQSAEARAGYARAAEHGRSPQPGSALLHLAEGRSNEAWTEICAAVSEADAAPFVCARLLRAQVRVALATSHAESAEAASLKLAGLAATWPTPGFSAWSDEAAGMVALAQGRANDAVTLLTRAAAAHRHLGVPYDAAVVDRMLAQAYRQLGDAGSARGCDDAADAVFTRLGAVDPMAPPGERPGGLTSRELEVLAQVATGLSNREAARALHITEATLRRHLANIYTKLNVSSRTAAAAWAHNRGLVPGGRA